MNTSARIVLVFAIISIFGCEKSSDVAPPAPEAKVSAPVEAPVSVLAEVPSGNYGLDKTHAYITFEYSHLGFSNPHIGFKDFDANLILDSTNPENSSLDVTIDPASVYSRVEKFDGHLKGDKFFDVANYPTISFKSSSIEVVAADKLAVSGELSIKGISKTVVLDTTINKAANHPMRKVPTIGASAMTKLNRSEWGLGEYVPNVGDEVTIYLEVEMPQAEAAQ